MLNTIAKVAIGAGIALVGAAIVVKVTKTVYVTVDKNGTAKEEPEEDKKLSERIKEAATQKVIDILGFCAKHMNEITTATAVLSLAGAVVDIICKVNKLKSEKKWRKDVDDCLDSILHNSYLSCVFANMSDEDFVNYRKNHGEIGDMIKRVIG